MEPTVGSLFAGMGGFDLAMERQGFRIAWQVECDRHARRVLHRHYPGIPCDRDVAGFSRIPRRLGDWHSRRERPDVIVGGFPCQDLSVAGKRAGLGGSRSGMWWQMLRIINGIQPRVICFENVPGLFSSDGGRDFARVVGSLGERGYFGAWRVLDAAHWVPQRRRRIFGVFARVGAGNPRRLAGATPREDGRRLACLCAQVLALGEGGTRHPQTGRTAGQDVAGTLAARSGGSGGLGTDVECGGGVIAFDESQSGVRLSAAHPTLDANKGSRRQEGVLAPHATQDPINGEVCPALSATASVAAYQCQGTNVGEMGTVRAGNGHTTGGVPFVIHGTPATEVASETDVACALRARTPGQAENSSTNVVYQANGAGGFREGQPSRATADDNNSNQVVVIRTNQTSSNGDNVSGGTRPPLDTAQPPAVVAFAQNQRDEVRDLAGLSGDSAAQPGMKQQTYIAHTPRASGADGSEDGTGRGTPMGTIGVGSVHRLTPTECLRLQGFPDWWLDGLKLADSVKYRLIGNAVAIPCVEWLAARLYALWPLFLEASP